MSKLFEVETSEGRFYVKADDVHQAEELLIAHYFDDNVDTEEVFETKEISMDLASTILIASEEGEERFTLKRVFDECLKQLDILTVPRELLS